MADFIGSSGDDFFGGTPDSDTINGLEGNDFLNGGGGDDAIDGGEGDDSLRGNNGDDTLIGGLGNDLLRGGAGVDSFDGGADYPEDSLIIGTFGDRISFFETAATQGVVADLRTGIISNDGFGNVESMTGIEALGADTAFIDTFYGNDDANWLLANRADHLYGFGGDDFFQLGSAAATIDGGDGFDTLHLTAGGGWLMPDADGNGIAEVAGPASSGWYVDLSANYFEDGDRIGGSIAGIESIVGSELNDVLLGDESDNAFEGGAGHDSLRGRGGNDILVGGLDDDFLVGGEGNDLIDGGAGFDRASFSSGAVAGIAVDLNLSGTAQDTGQGIDTLIGIEHVSGTRFDDTIIGDAADNWLWGGSDGSGVTGNDTISAADGNDLVTVGTGNHQLDGGAGTDTVALYGNGTDITSAGVTLDLRLQGIAQDTEQGLMTIIGFENAVGSIHDDVLIGDDGQNLLAGAEGSDQLAGGDGNDTLYGDGIVQPDTHGAGGSGPISLVQDVYDGTGGGNDVLDGGGGNDLLDGGDGADVMIGGAGDDIYVVSQPGDAVIEAPGEGTDEIRTMVDWGLPGDVENLTAIGTGNIFLGGNGGANLITGNVGDNYIVGAGGDDVIDGGAGADIAAFHLPAGTAGTLRIADGADGVLLVQLVQADGSFEDVFAVTVTGTGSAIVTGLGQVASLGTDRVDNVEDLHFFVQPPEGQDIAEGQFVNGRLAPGHFGDFVAGSEASDSYDLDDFAGAVNTTGNRGDDQIGGNALGNYMEGNAGNDGLRGEAGDDHLLGNAGNDYLEGGEGNDHLDGGEGADFMVGGTGNDTYYVTDGDGIHEAAGEGTDEIRTSQSWGLEGTNVEKLIAQGDGNIYLGGSQDANVIIGNAGDNYVETVGGDDYVDGGDGADISAYQLAPGTVGTLQIVDGTGEDAGKLLVQLVDGDTVQTVFKVTATAMGSAVIEGVGIGAGFGTDHVDNVEDLHFFVQPPEGQDIAEGQFVNVNLATRQFGDFVAGSDGADVIDLNGFPGAINANGNRGDDSMAGTDANNHFDGGSGNDTLSGMGGNDNLNGNAGDDVLTGGGGDDRLTGGAGNDQLDGGVGTNDIAAFSLAAGTAGSLRVVAGEGADLGTLIVERVDGATVEQIFRVTVRPAGATVEGLNSASWMGTDTVTNFDQLHFLVANPVFNPNQFAAITPARLGTSGNDLGVTLLNGGFAADTILGGDGHDHIRGNGSGDLLYGEGGNDLLVGGPGRDLIDGGAGIDRVSYYNEDPALGGATVSLLLQGFAQGTGGGGVDILVGIEQVSGTVFADVLVGDDGANWLWGIGAFKFLDGTLSANNDTLHGEGGDDLITVGIGDHDIDGGEGVDTLDLFDPWMETGFTVSLALQGSAQETGGGSWTIAGIENLSGSPLDDQLTGDDGANTLAGSDGADTLNGAGGDDVLTGDGYFDIASEGTGLAGPVFLELTGSGAFADELDGGAGNDTLIGGGGDDVLAGGSGDDFLIGGLGNDTIDGGEGGTDRAIFYFAPGTTGIFSIVAGTGADSGKLLVVRTDAGVSETVAEVTSAGGVVTVTGVNSAVYLGTETVTHVERLVFSILPPAPLANPVVAGYAVVDLTTDGVVADGYVAGATVFVDDNGNGVLDAGETSTVTDANGNFSLLTLGTAPIVAVGGTNVDTGLANEMVLTAPGGSTVVNPLTTLVQALVAQSNGATDAEAAEAQVKAALGLDPDLDLLNLDLLAAAGGGDAAALEAQQAAATVVAIIAAAEDAAPGGDAEGATLDALAGLVAGGEPVDLTDIAVITEVLTTALPEVEDLSSVIEQVAAAAEQIASATSLDELTEAQSQAMLTGNDLDNVLTGGARDDELSGFGGNDTLSGQDGDDRLAGGEGEDHLDGGAGEDTADYSAAPPQGWLRIGIVVSLGEDGYNSDGDVLTEIENVIGSVHRDLLTGNDLANKLWGGAGDDLLAGGGGDDSLYGEAGTDLFFGGHGFDQLAGGAGNDVFSFRSTSEISQFGGGAWIGRDEILDFEAGTSKNSIDRIDLSAIDANIGSRGDNEFRFIGEKAFSGKAGELHWIDQGIGVDGKRLGLIEGDVNGDKVADFQLVVHFDGMLGSSDFIF